MASSYGQCWCYIIHRLWGRHNIGIEENYLACDLCTINNHTAHWLGLLHCSFLYQIGRSFCNICKTCETSKRLRQAMMLKAALAHTPATYIHKSTCILTNTLKHRTPTHTNIHTCIHNPLTLIIFDIGFLHICEHHVSSDNDVGNTHSHTHAHIHTAHW